MKNILENFKKCIDAAACSAILLGFSNIIISSLYVFVNESQLFTERKCRSEDLGESEQFYFYCCFCKEKGVLGTSRREAQISEIILTEWLIC